MSLNDEMSSGGEAALIYSDLRGETVLRGDPYMRCQCKIPTPPPSLPLLGVCESSPSECCAPHNLYSLSLLVPGRRCACIWQVFPCASTTRDRWTLSRAAGRASCMPIGGRGVHKRSLRPPSDQKTYRIHTMASRAQRTHAYAISFNGIHTRLRDIESVGKSRARLPVVRRPPHSWSIMLSCSIYCYNDSLCPSLYATVSSTGQLCDELTCHF